MLGRVLLNVGRTMRSTVPALVGSDNMPTSIAKCT